MNDINRVNSVNKATYDELAEEYESRVSKRSAGNLDRVKYFSSFIKSGNKVLDVGCAVGLDVLHFNNLGFQTDGIEISPKMASFAKKRNPSSNILVGDFLALEIKNKYDAIFTRAFLHLFPKDIAINIIDKIYDLLVEDGVAFFGVSTAEESWEGWLKKDDYHNTPKRYKRLWTENELRKLLVQAGFEIVDIIKPTDAEGKKRVAITVRKPVVRP